MSKFHALFEDEDDIFHGTPKSKYWDIVSQTHQEIVEDEFDMLVTKIAALEAMLSQKNDYEALDKLVNAFTYENKQKVEELKKSIYMDLAGKLVYRHSD